MISIAHLEPASTQTDDPYYRTRPNHPGSVFVEGDTDESKSYEIGALLGRRTTSRKGKQRVQYLVRWKGYGPEWDEWYDEDGLDNARKLVKDYEQAETAKKANRKRVKNRQETEQ